MQEETVEVVHVTGGVDTHSQVHVGAIVNAIGRILGTASFPVSRKGYQDLLDWMRSFGLLNKIGVEGTGSYGAGLTRFLNRELVEVVEVNRPNRYLRRRRGKSDTTDAESAARAALNGEATGIPKSGDATVESIRVLRVARRSAVKACTQATNQLNMLVVTAPDVIHECLSGLSTKKRVEHCARFHRTTGTDPLSATKSALRSLARRYETLEAEIVELDQAISDLCVLTNPALMGAHGVGLEVAATLLVAAGDNPERMRNESSFAALCGSSPVEASSGKTVRHRLNQGGNREANNALWRIVMVRLSTDPETQAYAARRKSEGKSGREIMRCLKRYVAREIFRLLTNPPAVPNCDELRTTRIAANISLTTVARELGSWPTRISELERGLAHNTKLATRYQTWLTPQKTA
jgi:transposase